MVREDIESNVNQYSKHKQLLARRWLRGARKIFFSFLCEMIRVKGSGSRRDITYKSRSFLLKKENFYVLYCKILLFAKKISIFIFFN